MCEKWQVLRSWPVGEMERRREKGREVEAVEEIRSRSGYLGRESAGS